VDPDSKRLRVTVTDGWGRLVRDGGLASWLAAVAPSRASGDVAVALVTDARIRTLNRRYRRQDKVTDVLSFPAFADQGPANRLRQGYAESRRRAARAKAEAGRHIQQRTADHDATLGDIVIASGAARRQAKAAGHSVQQELRVLSLHGLLHLLGYDHHDPDDYGRMARVEARLRRAGGLPVGLIERAGERARA
jgi:probable rRNA maturation factor